MILSSPSSDVDQTPPVTTTFDAPDRGGVTPLRRRDRGVRIDWSRVETLYAFVRARALERLHAAEQGEDVAAVRTERRSLHAIEAMHTQGRQGNGVVAALAITFFRARAMRDAHHPGFLGEWLGSTTLARRAAS